MWIILIIMMFSCVTSNAQYLGVRARYTDSRVLDGIPGDKRESRLVLSFYSVSPVGVYTPVSLTNYELWIFKEGLQYGSSTGGVLDSSGNNYNGYEWTAPRAVAYYNSIGRPYIDCLTGIAEQFIVNV